VSHGIGLTHPVRILAVALSLLVATSVGAQQAPQTITEIRIEGNQQVPDSVVMSYIKSRPGERYDRRLVEQDVQRLLDSGRFTSVQASLSTSDRGVTVTYHLVERPLVAAVIFEGNKALKDSDLAQELSFGTFSPLNRFDVEAGRKAIQAKYRSEGYYFAKVDYDEQALNQEQRVVYRIVEGPKVAVRSVTFRGNEYWGRFKLAMKVRTSAGFWLGGLALAPGKLDTEQLEQDVNRLRAEYAAEGFLDVNVDRLLEFSDDKRQVRVTFVIDEGPRYVVNDTKFEGNSVFTDQELLSRVSLTPGEYYTALAMQRDIKALRDTYGQIGFINASVDAKYVYKTSPGLLDMHYRIKEDGQYNVGEIIIRGNTETQDRVIRRKMQVYPGQLYNSVAVEESRHRLLETALFKDVKITPIPRDSKTSDILVQVTEAQTSNLIIGAGISSRDGLIGNVEFKQRNFDLFGWPKSWSEFIRGKSFKGAGQTLRISAEPGTELMRFGIEWFEPYLFDRPYSLGLSSYLFTRQRETYDETRYGGVASFGHRFKNRWYGELSSRIEGIKVDSLDTNAPPEVVADKGTHFITGIKGTLIKDRTDSRWLPSKGDRFHLSFEQVVGGYTFAKAVGDYRKYWTVYVDAMDRKHIIAARFTLGQIFGDAPVFERFYGGGIGSVRGFRYRGISPRSTVAGSDQPVGGDTMIFAGCEYSFPIYGTPREGQLRGVVFLDTGTVEDDFSITTYRTSIGAGLRWTVPFFGPIPIALDFGFPLSKDEKDDTEIFSFSLGLTF